MLKSATSVSLSDSDSVYNKPGLPLIVIDNTQCHAVIALQGAHLVEFERKSDDDSSTTPLLWLSPKAIFAPGKAIRGGIPFCFPWFGPHSLDPNAPQHGFARVRQWDLTRACETQVATELTFTLVSDEETLKAFPHAFSAELHFSLGRTLCIELTVHNLSASTMPVGWALHSYFPIGDTTRAHVPELVGRAFVDQTDNRRQKQLLGNLDFSQHTDAVFLQSPDQITLQRPAGDIAINSHNAPTTVVWNPNALANTMADLGPGTYSQFVCVERGAVFDDRWQLPAKEAISARMCISD